MLYLASQSPRRAELLRQIGVEFTAIPADINEACHDGETAEAYVKRMAMTKAMAVQSDHPGEVVLGSDTAVVCDGEILGKPSDAADAVTMLLKLSGRSHQVLTGVALAHQATDYRLSSSEVRFRVISPQEAQAYVAGREPMDKAGGYAVQGYAAVFIEHIAGSYSGIMGLPLFETAALLKLAGMEPSVA